ncbi:hypothetical protein LF845_08320 [Deferribacterales bacterium Es71-Z0220]|uniref:hypothetical protein n=1 Tax=Deferrivibrio essentukiensis TaxID=2880922 RepID=UPI001F619B43|nr:hypothetical protein [Deferrivibrio essentukiensis]MCB4204963.1 hypothetical protein [Deferrivibrio essentukiensis]
MSIKGKILPKFYDILIKPLISILRVLGYILFFLVLLLFGYVSINFSDIGAFGFILITALLILYQFVQIYTNSRRLLSIYFREGSFLNRFFNKKSFLVVLLAIFASIVLAITTYGIAALMIKENPLLFIFSTSISIAVINILYRFRRRTKMIDDNLAGQLADYVITLLEVFLFTFITNIILTVIYTYHDYNLFFINDVNLNNFSDHALKNAIPKAEANNISRKMFNIFILLDYFKQAISFTIIDAFFEREQLRSSFLVVVIFILDFIKYFSFSMGLVLIVKGLHRVALFVVQLFSKLVGFLVQISKIHKKVSNKIKVEESKNGS